MADTTNTIDTLELKIEIGLTKQKTEVVSSLATAITKLNKAVSDTSGIKSYVAEMNKLAKIMGAISKTTYENAGGKTTKPKAQKGTEPKPSYVNVDSGKQEIKIEQELLSIEKEQTNEIKSQNSVIAERTQLKINETKQQKENTKETKKSATAWSKLIKSIGRIAFYRAIRTALKEIVQAAKEGIANVRSVDKDLDTAMKKMSQSGTALKNSFGVALSVIIKTVEPLITRIADGIANIVNRISEAKAALSGATTYTKILTSDTEEWQKQLKEVEGSLLSFDKFESLSNKTATYTGVVEADVGISQEEASGIVTQLRLIETSILAIVASISLLKISSVISNLSNLKSGLTGVLGAVSAIVGGVTLMTSGILDMINLFKNGGSTIEWFAAGLKILAGALAVVFGILVMVKAAKSAKTIVGAIAGVVIAASLIVGGIAASKKAGSDIQAFADGGMVPKGTSFIAGEAGAEVVHKSSSGTGVTNIEQFKTAMVQALYEYGASRDGASEQQINLYIDKTKVGQTTASPVYNELVRTGRMSKAY